MFTVIENARMTIGVKSAGTLSTGYLNALAFAKQRVQGAQMAQMADKSAPRVTIIHHPEVRRSLMTQKSYAEGLRALYLYPLRTKMTMSRNKYRAQTRRWPTESMICYCRWSRAWAPNALTSC
jgi:alkylation response protein AidB-like acyl-CoA dehydrogenase